MADLKISQLSPLTGANTAADDVLPIVDTNANQTKKIRADELFKSLSAGTVLAPAVTPAGDQNTGIFFPAADTIAFAEGGVESARLDSTGALTFAKAVYDTPFSEDFYRIKLENPGGTANDTGIGQPATGSMGFNIGPLGIYQWNAGTDGEVMRIDAGGNLLVGKTSATANGGDLQISKGITFPATQAAQSDVNTLDDYEEGTWTPVLTFGGSSTGITYQAFNQLGYYQKIGNIVYFSCTQYLSNKGAQVGTAIVSGLPFVSGRGNGGRSALSINLASATFTGQFQAQMDFQAAQIVLANITEAGVNAVLTDSNFTNTTTYHITGFYAVS